MRTFFDEVRVASESDRRFHAVDCERAGIRVWLPPAVARSLVPELRSASEGLARRILAMQRAEGIETGRHGQMLDAERKLWWLDEWRQKGGIFKVATLGEWEEGVKARLLAEDGMPREFFRRCTGALRDHNDAQIYAEVMALGGKMVVTSNMEFVNEDGLMQWLKANHNRIQVEPRRIVVDADTLLVHWTTLEGGVRSLMKSCLAAAWPESDAASTEEVRKATADHVDALRRGHLKRFGEVMAQAFSHREDMDQLTREVREALPTRARRAEARRNRRIEKANEEFRERHEGAGDRKQSRASSTYPA